MNFWEAAMLRLVAKDVRCFRELDAPIAPLTLLVGENSTGKSTFLALFQLAWDVAFEQGEGIKFNSEPFRLGAYDDIAHFHGGQGKRVKRFEIGFDVPYSGSNDSAMIVRATFVKAHGHPILVRRTVRDATFSVDTSRDSETGHWTVILTSGARRQEITFRAPGESARPIGPPPLDVVLRKARWGDTDRKKKGKSTEVKPSDEDLDQISDRFVHANIDSLSSRPWASAPVRSEPKRSYDPLQDIRQPGGDHVPMLLARLARETDGDWKQLHDELVKFGEEAGLLDDLSVALGKKEADPFRIDVHIPGQQGSRSLVDVGYGVSQALPILVDALRSRNRWLLMQQPEVHLHPKAQAAVGTLLARMAHKAERHFVVETHSDYLVDRVCMEVRDGMPPDMVSLLYFEPDEAAVRVHRIQLDKRGNLVDPPPGFRAFFLAEQERFLGL